MKRSSFLKLGLAGLAALATKAKANVFTFADLAFMARAQRKQAVVNPVRKIRLSASSPQSFTGVNVESTGGFVVIRDENGYYQIIASGTTWASGMNNNFIEMWSCNAFDDPTEYGAITLLESTGNPINVVDALADVELITLDVSNTGLTDLIIDGTAMVTLDASGNALPQATVDDVLAELAASSVNNGTVDLSGGTNAAPGVAGLTAKTTLEGRGWTVTVNS